MTELRVLGRSGSNGAVAPVIAASVVPAGVEADIVIAGGNVVVDEAAGGLLVKRASAVDENSAPAVPARSHGLGGEAVVIVAHS